MAHFIQAIDSEQIFDINKSLWEKNCQEHQLLVRYFAMPIKESEDTLWLAVESNNNIEAFETFTFLFDKFIEPVMVD